MTNLSGFTRTVSAGTVVGVGEPVELLLQSEDENGDTAAGQADIRNLSSTTVEWRKKRLLEQLQFEEVPPAEASQLKEFLTEHHAVFSLEDGERGETDIIAILTLGTLSQSGNPHVACLSLLKVKWPSSSMTCNRMESFNPPLHLGRAQLSW